MNGDSGGGLDSWRDLLEINCRSVASNWPVVADYDYDPKLFLGTWIKKRS